MFMKKKFGDLREFNLNDAEDKWVSNKEFIMSRVRGQVGQTQYIYIRPEEWKFIF